MRTAQKVQKQATRIEKGYEDCLKDFARPTSESVKFDSVWRFRLRFDESEGQIAFSAPSGICFNKHRSSRACYDFDSTMRLHPDEK